MNTLHLICVIYYLLLFVMLPSTLLETEMTTLFQDVAYRYKGNNKITELRTIL